MISLPNKVLFCFVPNSLLNISFDRIFIMNHCVNFVGFDSR
jgi:hypothetical protein